MHSLTTLHTFKLPSSAQTLFIIQDVKQAQLFASQYAHDSFYILGEGSNTVFLEDFVGVVAKIEIKGITLSETTEHFLLSVGAGESWHQLVLWCMQKQIYGFQNLALIPGTVGAAPVQNIGAYGIEIERFIASVEYVDLQKNTLCQIAGNDCEFAYRDSIFKQALAGKCLITRVNFALPKIWQCVSSYAELAELNSPTAQDIFNKVVEVRQRKLPDPKLQGNAGSFFKNPVISHEHLAKLQAIETVVPFFAVDEDWVKVPAAWFLDKLGFKGQQRGGVACHINQPLVLVNMGNASGNDVLALATEMKQAVLSHYGVNLQNEVRLVGRNGLVDI